MLEINLYKHSQASLCLVLPPVGNARSAILLLSASNTSLGPRFLAIRKIQIQVCVHQEGSTRVARRCSR